jgi:hypothetical protein
MAVGVLYGLYVHVKRIGYEEAVAEYKVQAGEADAKRRVISEPIAAAAEVAQVQVRTLFKTIFKEVPVYVEATDCPLRGGFRVLHDAAANVVVPTPPPSLMLPASPLKTLPAPSPATTAPAGKPASA